ncbi:ComEC family competence protein [Chloroflexia bacterium SDU3-3]|nr:ComEC family competence protein [Chloroflexia bacterium SDU3-3]
MRLITLSLAWLIGIVIADLLHLPLPPLLAAAALCGLGAAIAGRAPRLRLALLALCCAALGGARLASAQVQPTPQSIWLRNGAGELSIQGVVAEDPKRTDDGQSVLVQAEMVALGGRRSPAQGLVLVKLPAYPERRYGDVLLLTGTLKTPNGPKRPGDFDYRDYLARRQIFSLMDATQVRALGQRPPNALLAALLGLRDAARRTLLRELPEPQSSLAVGILLGIQSSIPEDVYESFSLTGTSHILVISGWNISIIGAALYALAERMRLSKRAAFWAILTTIWLYTAFVGLTPTVIRAAVMGSIVVLGQRLERPAHAWTTLAAACAAMALWNPQVLWDMGFQLSALATASLFAFGKGTEALLNRTFLRADWLGWAREALTATLAAQILALPLILYAFGNLSIVAPLANVVLLPVVPYAMLFGALALVAGLVWLPLGQLAALPAYLFLAWLTEGARLFAALPYAAVLVPPFPLWALLAYYAAVLGLRFGPWPWRAPEAAPLHLGDTASPIS